MSIPIDALAVGKAIAAVADERCAQHAKWGEQRHSWPEWLSILTEEVGEAAQAANQLHWAPEAIPLDVLAPITGRLRAELVQVAAVAVQIIEHIDEEIAKHEGH